MEEALKTNASPDVITNSMSLGLNKFENSGTFITAKILMASPDVKERYAKFNAKHGFEHEGLMFGIEKKFAVKGITPEEAGKRCADMG